MPLKPAEMERIIVADGWFFVRQKGSHKHYKHNSLDITGSLTQPHY